MVGYSMETQNPQGKGLLQLLGSLQCKITEFLNLRRIWSRMRELISSHWLGIYKYDLEDEAQRLLKEVKIAIEMVQESHFYAKLLEQIRSAAFRDQLKSFLGSHSKLKMVIYGLGSMEFSYNSQYQLAIALLLAKDCSWIEGIQVYDPLFSPADVIVLKEFGCEVLVFNERCRRKVERPTLFYMPYAETTLLENLFEANWCPSQINQLMVLKSRIKHSPEYFIQPISEYIKEIIIENYGDYDGICNGFAWHFFDVDSQLNMENFLTGKLSKKRLLINRWWHDIQEPFNFLEEESIREKIFTDAFAEDETNDDGDWTFIYGEYRGPRKYRCCSKPPPKGWIKLNISGRGSDGDMNPAGFGGICQNEFKKTILSYNGALGQVDEYTACIEALRHGLVELSSKYDYKNLIVEGDNLKVIQWLNKWHELPEEIHQVLDEVFDLLKRFNCVIYHIYEEANFKANSLAKKGAICVLVHDS